jgi:hypothetical protein
MALGPFTAEAASNLPSGTDAHRGRRAGPPDHVSTLSGPGICPYPASYPGRSGGGPAIPSWFPVAFRPPAFASWSSCARRGAGPSLRSAYRSCCQGRTPTGLPRSARVSCGRGGCPLYPGDCGARTAGRSSPAAARRLAAARPCTPVQQPTTGGFLSRGIIKGSRSFTRPAFPSPVAPGWSGSPRACPPGLHTPPLPAAHAGVGTGIVGTCLSYVTISWSSSQRSHSPRATSCRTDLIRAFPHPSGPSLSCPQPSKNTPFTILQNPRK